MWHLYAADWAALERTAVCGAARPAQDTAGGAATRHLAAQQSQQTVRYRASVVGGSAMLRIRREEQQLATWQPNNPSIPSGTASVLWVDPPCCIRIQKRAKWQPNNPSKPSVQPVLWVDPPRWIQEDTKKWATKLEKAKKLHVLFEVLDGYLQYSSWWLKASPVSWTSFMEA